MRLGEAVYEESLGIYIPRGLEHDARLNFFTSIDMAHDPYLHTYLFLLLNVLTRQDQTLSTFERPLLE